MERQIREELVPDQRDLAAQKKLSQLREHYKGDATRDLTGKMKKQDAVAREDRRMKLERATSKQHSDEAKDFARTAKKLVREKKIDQEAYDLLKIDDSLRAQTDLELALDDQLEPGAKIHAAAIAKHTLARGQERIAAQNRARSPEAEALLERGKQRIKKQKLERISDPYSQVGGERLDATAMENALHDQDFDPVVEFTPSLSPQVDSEASNENEGGAFDWSILEAGQPSPYHDNSDRKKTKSPVERQREDLRRHMAAAEARRAAEQNQDQKKSA